MLRRDFLKTTASVLAASSLAPGEAFSQSGKAGSRSVFAINRNWRFTASTVESAHLPEFNDAAFEKVTIPTQT